MKKQVFFTITILFLCTVKSLNAQIKIAFIKVYKPDCSLLYLESNFEYSHVAISYKDGWLNAHPKHGVQFTSLLEELDFPKIEYHIIENPFMPELTEQEVGRFIGKPYNNLYDWYANDKYYCTELIAKLLDVPPKPMFFDPRYWPEKYQKLNGKPGMSPFSLLKKLLKRDFLPYCPLIF